MVQFPELREADAPPAIAEIYGDIKQVAMLPQVNLIFRYFATEPGVLEWVWTTLRPLYASQELAEAAKNLSLRIERTGPSPLSAALDSADLDTARQVLAAYNSGNPQNLIALTVLIKLLEGRNQPRSPRLLLLSPRDTEAVSTSSNFPPLPRRDNLSPDVMALVERMGARHGGVAGVVPSLYLHLALWPAALDRVDAFLEPIITRDDWPQQVAQVLTEADELATHLQQGVELLAEPPDEATLSRVTDTVRTFIKNTIPELIVVGRLLAI